MGAMVFSVQPKAKAESRTKESIGTVAEVTVSIDSFAALPPYLAYDDIIEEAATLHGVDADLIHAIIQAESAFNPSARSHKGAMGLMQLMPATAAELGVTDPYDPEQNIRGGVMYLKSLLTRYQHNEELALAAYNAGPGAVARYGSVPPYRETRDYIARIKTNAEGIKTTSAPARRYCSCTSRTRAGSLSVSDSKQRLMKMPLPYSIVPIAPSQTRTRSASASRNGFN
jgi:soluble lytic murein transglycosylase-like protein